MSKQIRKSCRRYKAPGGKRPTRPFNLTMPGCELSARFERGWIGYAGSERGRGDKAHARDRLEPLARGILPVPCHQLPFDIADLGGRVVELTRQSQKRATSGNPRASSSRRRIQSSATFRGPCAAMIPNSAKCARIAFRIIVRCRINRSTVGGTGRFIKDVMAFPKVAHFKRMSNLDLRQDKFLKGSID